MEKKRFCHLHLHTEYSLLDSSAKIKNVISRAKELGMESIAITDHGVMYGCVAFYKEAIAQGIKPILGCEVYVAGKSMNIKINDKDNGTYHLVLLVKNEVGYENLMKIVSAASIDGFYYKPRVDHDFLRKHSEGLIALSACLGGEVQKNLLNDDYEKSKEVALMYKDIFKDGFYLEIQDHGMEEQRKVTEGNIKLSRETGIPLIATNDVHYINQEDSKAHDILMCIQTGKTVEDQNRRRYPSNQFYLKSPEEMWDMFSYVPEALENTIKIADECNFDYEFHVSKLPNFPVPQEYKTHFDYLEEVCFEGLVERYDVFEQFKDKLIKVQDIKNFAETNEEAKEYVDRLSYELSVINQMGYVDYFLITWDFIKYSNDHGIPTGPGRGCFLPGTEILLSNGSIKSIEDIKIGDEVITAYGNLQLVENLLRYDIKEKIITIESANEKVKLTSDHKMLAIKAPQCTKEWQDRSNLPVIYKKGCSFEEGCINKPYEEYKAEWIEANKLEKNDFILYPRTKEAVSDITYDLLEYCKQEEHLRYDENHIWYEIGSNNLQTNKINRFIKLDEDLCKLYGYFISEGWTTINEDIREYKFGFGFNKKETEYIDDAVNLVNKIFALQGRIAEHKTKEDTYVEFNSKVISEFLKQQCNKGANNKRIPYDVIKNTRDYNLKLLVANMFRGDGSYSDINCEEASFRIKYTTTSIELTRQLRMILARLGYWSTFKTRFKEQEQMHDEYSVCISGKQLLRWNDDFENYKIPVREQKFYRNDSFYMDDDYFYIKIKNKTEEEYTGKVYDLSVPGDTSYVANSMAVHNSAAGSIVAYTLGITKINPIKYSLLFERFLNPERVSMPDIDSDFCYERRQEVIDYVVDKYGVNNVSQIITFGTMAARLCLRDVGRAMNYSYAEVDRIAKMIPTMLGITIEKALDLNPELKAAYENEDRLKTLIDVSKTLEGLPRHSSTHAAGVVIASKPLVEYVPLQRNEDMIVTQFDMTTLEELGLLKMDFLGLRTLTVMSDTVKMIKENRGIDIDLDKIDFEDKNVYNMIGEGKTAGVFQLESPGMTSFMKELKPDCLEDIIAGISLYRPGPMSEIPRYIDGKRNKDSVHYETPELENILDVTYGVMVYQEQVMQIVRDLGGYSLGRSDMVRRAMSKKKHSVMEQERKNFIYGIVDKDGNVEVPGCLRNGISEKAANEIFDQMMDFASYAFNKSHAAAYAVIGYQTAYLMHYYPVETIAAMVNSVMGISEKVAHYTKFAESLGIQVLPPNINESYSKFTVKGNSIRFGLAAIKNVGLNVVDGIVEARKNKGKFESLVDFINKIDLSTINKRAIESLIKAGAFDEFKIFRSKLLAVYEKLMDSVASDKKRNIDGQISLFGMVDESIREPEVIYPDIKEFAKNNLLSMEKEMTGLYISGHPLDEYEKSLKMMTSTTIETIFQSYEAIMDGLGEDEHLIQDNQRVILGGILAEVNQKVTRNNSIMAFLRLEDLTGVIEVVVFPKTLEKTRNLINLDSMVIIKGRVSIKEDEEPKLICESIEPLEKINSDKVYIRVDDLQMAKFMKSQLVNITSQYKGDSALYVFTANDRKNYRMPRDMWVNLNSEVLFELKKIFGESNVKIVE